jgi:hypothetical protein
MAKMAKVTLLRPDLYKQAVQILERAGRIPVWDPKSGRKRDLTVGDVVRLLRLVEGQKS